MCGKDRRNFGQKPKNAPGNSRFTRFTGRNFFQDRFGFRSPVLRELFKTLAMVSWDSQGTVFQFVPDTAEAPEIVLFFKRYNQVFDCSGERRPAGPAFPV
jgi:hypothetical protein